VENERTNASAGNVPWAFMHLCPFPQIAIRVMRMVSQEESPMYQLSELISTDSAFASELLTIANSPLYAPRIPARSILEAIYRMGTRHIQGLCLTVASRTYLGKALNLPAMKTIWNHNLACALISEQLAMVFRMNKDDAYTAGVMHEIGRLAMAAIKPTDYAALLSSYTGTATDILASERELFGFDHSEAGMKMVEGWHLPEHFEGVVNGQHTRRETTGPWEMADVVHLSCRMADAIGFAAFPGCVPTLFADLVAELPEWEASHFHADAESLANEVGGRIASVAAI